MSPAQRKRGLGLHSWPGRARGSDTRRASPSRSRVPQRPSVPEAVGAPQVGARSLAGECDLSARFTLGGMGWEELRPPESCGFLPEAKPLRESLPSRALAAPAAREPRTNAQRPPPPPPRSLLARPGPPPAAPPPLRPQVARFSLPAPQQQVRPPRVLLPRPRSMAPADGAEQGAAAPAGPRPPRTRCAVVWPRGSALRASLPRQDARAAPPPLQPLPAPGIAPEPASAPGWPAVALGRPHVSAPRPALLRPSAPPQGRRGPSPGSHAQCLSPRVPSLSQTTAAVCSLACTAVVTRG